MKPKTMKNILTFCSLIYLVTAANWLYGQNARISPSKVEQAVYFDISPPIRDIRAVLTTTKGTLNDSREVYNKFGFKEHASLKSTLSQYIEDPVWQKQDETYMPATASLLQNFEGINNLSGVYPPDTQGDVSLDDYIQVVNLKFSIYSKTGSVILGPLDLSTIWSGIPAPWNNTNNGDPVVLYDQAANRWLIMQFSLPNSSQYAILVAVSATPDPTGSWYRYVFQYGSKMPDYPKLGIWPDGYYLSVNQFNYTSQWNFLGVGASALDRTKMLAGDPTAAMQYFDLGADSDPGSMLPSDWDGPVAPAAGEPNHFTYFNDWSVGGPFLKIWDFHVDWTTPANSTFAEVTSLVTAPFDAAFCGYDGGQCIPQPGTAVKLATLSDRLMYRLQYRKFGSYSAMVTNHSVDVNGSDHAGVRWYELRNTGTGWNIYQQGTYAPDAAHRWMGSIAMNAMGDIALGYSVSDPVTVPNVYPGIRFTGRKAGDALGIMTLPEQTIMAGSGYQSGSAGRWGDYSMMSVDPSDDLTFWYTTEYIQTSGGAPWRTRIASFNMPNMPSVITLPAYAITNTTATLSGTVNPHGLATNYHFEYGYTTAYGTSTATIYSGSGSSAIPVAASITGLTPESLVHFRLVAVNSDGTSYGNDLTFTTLCGLYSLPFFEGFATNSAPACWSQIDQQGNGQIWQFGAITNQGTSNPALTGNYAFLNSDAYGSDGVQNVGLVSPTLDLTGFTTAKLSFSHYFRPFTASSGTLSYSIDNGANWVEIQTFTSTSNPALFSQSLPEVTGHSQVKFKWNYIGVFGWYWAVDNVEITGLPINRQLSNIDITGGTMNCYNAAQTITVAGFGTTFKVRNGGSTTLIAGQKISILPGATVYPGGYFWGYIAPTGPFCTNPAYLPLQEENLTGISEEAPNTNIGNLFSVYPNPTNGKFTLELTGMELSEKIRIEIYGIRGEKILTKEGIFQRTQEFSLADSPVGLYFIRVFAGEHVESMKILKY
jgi:hypothetical protein